MLYTFIYLQGSQTSYQTVTLVICFTPLFTYKVLKLASYRRSIEAGFTPLFTYKVLKHSSEIDRLLSSFTPLFTYKVLKPITLRQ